VPRDVHSLSGGALTTFPRKFGPEKNFSPPWGCICTQCTPWLRLCSLLCHFQNDVATLVLLQIRLAILCFQGGFHQHRSNRRFTDLQSFLTASYIGLAFHQQKLTFAQLQLADCVVDLLSDAAIGWEVLLSSMTLAVVCVTFISHSYFLTGVLTGDCGSVKSNWGLT